MVSSITKVHISWNSQVRPSNRETHTHRQRLNKIQNKVSFILRCLLETIVFNSAIISILLFLVNFTILPPHLVRLAQIHSCPRFLFYHLNMFQALRHLVIKSIKFRVYSKFLWWILDIITSSGFTLSLQMRERERESKINLAQLKLKLLTKFLMAQEMIQPGTQNTRRCNLQ